MACRVKSDLWYNHNGRRTKRARIRMSRISLTHVCWVDSYISAACCKLSYFSFRECIIRHCDTRTCNVVRGWVQLATVIIPRRGNIQSRARHVRRESRNSSICPSLKHATGKRTLLSVDIASSRELEFSLTLGWVRQAHEDPRSPRDEDGGDYCHTYYFWGFRRLISVTYTHLVQNHASRSPDADWLVVPSPAGATRHACVLASTCLSLSCLYSTQGQLWFPGRLILSYCTVGNRICHQMHRALSRIVR